MAVQSAVRSRSRQFSWRFILENPLSIGFRILFLLILSYGIALGALNQTYSISALAASIGIDPDAILVVIGIVNKVLDYALGDTLTHIASVSLTLWLATKTRFAGVGWHDLDLETEMSKPYVSIHRFWKKWRSPEHSLTWWDFARLIFTFACGMAVLLLGAMVNILVIPKTIWLPGTTNGVTNITTVGMHFEIPTQYISAISWDTTNRTQFQVAQGNALQSINTASSIVQAVANMVPAISHCSNEPIYCQEPSYFRLVSSAPLANGSAEECFRSLFCKDTPARYSWIQPLENRARSMSSNIQIATDLYQTALANQKIAQKSTCIRNWFNRTLPIVESQCLSTNSTTGNSTYSVTFEETSNGGIIRTLIGGTANSSQSFDCTSNLSQWLHPMYVYGCKDSQYNTWENWPNTQFFNATLLNTTAFDSAILQAVAQRFSLLSNILDPLSGGSFAAFISDIGTAAIPRNSSIPGPRTREVGTALAVGTAISQLVTLADWTVIDSGETNLSGPLQFLVYGSGPRQMWQWVLVIIAGICILVMFYDLYLIAFKPGPTDWLSSPNLIVFANNSDRLDYPLNEKLIEKDRKTRLYARNLNGRDTLTLNPNAGQSYIRPAKEIGAGRATGVELSDFDTQGHPVQQHDTDRHESTMSLLPAKQEHPPDAAAQNRTETT